MADEGAPITGQHPHLAERLGRHMARGGQTELAHPRQPHAVGDIGLAALELLDLAGVDQRHRDAGCLQHLERRQPVDAGAFHHRGVDAPLTQPRDHRVEAARERLEGARLDLRLAGAGRAHTHRDGDLHLVHVKARGARVDDVQGIGHHGFTSRSFGGKAEAGGAGRTGLTPVTDVVRFAVRPRHGGREQSGARSRPAGASLDNGKRRSPLERRSLFRLRRSHSTVATPRRVHRFGRNYPTFMLRGGCQRADHDSLVVTGG